MKIGSQTHKELFCQSLIDSHIEYQPEQLPWPELEPADLERLRQVPFWEEALNTELAAGAKIAAYLPLIDDPLVRQAVALQGEEESRHGRLFRFLIEHYGIELSGRAPDPVTGAIEPAFLEFGYGECLDAFLGFGVFKIARESGFLPTALFDIFDILLQEEARHIVFFVNWVAYMQVQRGRGNRALRAASSLWHYGRAVKGLMALVGRATDDEDDEADNDFSATEAAAFLEDLTIQRLLSECLAENKRRMSSFDSRLLQPRLLPSLAQTALSVFNRLPQRGSTAAATAVSEV